MPVLLEHTVWNLEQLTASEESQRLFFEKKRILDLVEACRSLEKIIEPICLGRTDKSFRVSNFFCWACDSSWSS